MVTDADGPRGHSVFIADWIRTVCSAWPPSVCQIERNKFHCFPRPLRSAFSWTYGLFIQAFYFAGPSVKIAERNAGWWFLGSGRTAWTSTDPMGDSHPCHVRSKFGDTHGICRWLWGFGCALGAMRQSPAAAESRNQTCKEENGDEF
jgi:hypothetical protein